MATALELKNAIDQFVEKSAAWAYQIVNGADNASVVTDGGTLPTFAKALKDFQDEANAALAEFDAILANIPEFATLAEANAAEPHNVLFFNTTLNRFQMTV